MSVEAIWAVTFGASAQGPFGSGAGVVTLDAGRVLGGDSGLYYFGTYKFENGNFIFTVSADTHNPAMPSVFGIPKFDLVGSGEVSSDQKQINFLGFITGNPAAQLYGRLTRLVELPPRA